MDMNGYDWFPNFNGPTVEVFKISKFDNTHSVPCNYLATQGFKLNYVSKRGPGSQRE